MRLRTRLVTGYATLVVLTLACVLFAGRALLVESVTGRLDAIHDAEYAEITRYLAQPDAENTLKRYLDFEDNRVLKFVVRERGRLVFASEGLDADAIRLIESFGKTVTESVPSFGECHITSRRVGPYAVSIITPTGTPVSVADEFSRVIVAVLAAGLAASLLLGWLFSRWAVRPIARMEEAARRIGLENLNERLHEDSRGRRDELGSLGRLLNEMLDRIRDSVDRIRRYTVEVSHELRTPMSIVRLNAERIRDMRDLPPAAKELAAEQIEEIDRLNRFVGNLLSLAKVDAGAIHMECRDTPWGEFLEDFAEDAELLSSTSDRVFELAPPPEGAGHFDPGWMRQVLFNLLSNAIRVSPPGGRITLRATHGREGWNLSMEDEGPGLAPLRLASIFDRYTRFGDDRGPGAGTGVGLALCRSVVALHGGSIRAENRADRTGLRVVVTLPEKY